MSFEQEGARIPPALRAPLLPFIYHDAAPSTSLAQTHNKATVLAAHDPFLSKALPSIQLRLISPP